jgi:hypothetical protein
VLNTDAIIDRLRILFSIAIVVRIEDAANLVGMARPDLIELLVLNAESFKMVQFEGDFIRPIV